MYINTFINRILCLRIRNKCFGHRHVASVLTIIHRRLVRFGNFRVHDLGAHHRRIASMSRHHCTWHHHICWLLRCDILLRPRLVPRYFAGPARVATRSGIITTMSAIVALRCDRFIYVGFIGGHFSHHGRYHGVH